MKEVIKKTLTDKNCRKDINKGMSTNKVGAPWRDKKKKEIQKSKVGAPWRDK